MKVAELFEESKAGLNSQVDKAYKTAKAKPKYDAKKVAKKDWKLYGSPESDGKSQRVVTTPDGKKKKVTGQDDSHPRGGKQRMTKESMGSGEKIDVMRDGKVIGTIKCNADGSYTARIAGVGGRSLADAFKSEEAATSALKKAVK